MQGITADQLMNGVVVILAILAAIVAIDKFVDVIKKWRKPERDITECLRADRADLEQHDKDIKALKDGQKVMCKGVEALLDHAIHDGNTEQMESAKAALSTYLQNLIG